MGAAAQPAGAAARAAGPPGGEQHGGAPLLLEAALELEPLLDGVVWVVRPAVPPLLPQLRQQLLLPPLRQQLAPLGGGYSERQGVGSIPRTTMIGSCTVGGRGCTRCLICFVASDDDAELA